MLVLPPWKLKGSNDMALEARYIVGNNQENGYPVIYREVLLDGVEVARGEPNFAEVQAADPSIIQEYFDAVSAWAQSLAEYYDAQTGFTADNYTQTLRASRFFYDFDQKFDYATYASQMPQFQAPPAVESAEETPVDE